MTGMNRRDFLKGSAALAGGLAIGAQGVAAVAQQPQKTLRFGLIGCGGMGSSHLNAIQGLKNGGYAVDVVAVCDVYQPRLSAAAERTGGKAYTDYKELLKHEGLDCVGIATPDHWHAQMTIDAANAGKDIYCEKPMTLWKDLSEAVRVVEAVKSNGRVMQVGTQGTSDGVWQSVAEAVGAGKTGKLISVQASDMRNGPLGVYDPASNDGQARPGENLDWEQWLGPAPKVAWEPGRFFAFRSYWDYSGGVGTDFFPHLLTPLVKSLSLEFPSRVTAIGGQYVYTQNGREIPDIFNLLVEYPDGPNLILMGSLATSENIPTTIRGHEGVIVVGGQSGAAGVIKPERRVTEGREEEPLASNRPGSLEEHYRDFFECVRSREQPRSDAELGYRVMSVLHMGIRSFREGRTMDFRAG